MELDKLHVEQLGAGAVGERQSVTGVVVNTRPNLARERYDRLKAELHQLGLRSRSVAVDPALRAPLLGRLAWARQFLAASRVEKLTRMFAAIQFSADR